jgi:hypothetical protein
MNFGSAQVPQPAQQGGPFEQVAGVGDGFPVSFNRRRNFPTDIPDHSRKLSPSSISAVMVSQTSFDFVAS